MVISYCGKGNVNNVTSYTSFLSELHKYHKFELIFTAKMSYTMRVYRETSYNEVMGL